MKLKILPIDKINSNGRIYTRNVVEKAVARLEGRTLLGTVGYLDGGRAPGPGDKCVLTACDFRVEGNSVMCVASVTDPEVLDMLQTGCAVVHPGGIGDFDNATGAMVNFKLSHLAVMAAHESAWSSKWQRLCAWVRGRLRPRKSVHATVRVVCAAMKMDDGLIVTGVRHYSPDMRATLFRIYGDRYHLKVVEQGFIDTAGNFLTREWAWEVAKAAGQIRRQVNKPGTLFSENLY